MQQKWSWWQDRSLRYKGIDRISVLEEMSSTTWILRFAMKFVIWSKANWWIISSLVVYTFSTPSCHIWLKSWLKTYPKKSHLMLFGNNANVDLLKPTWRSLQKSGQLVLTQLSWVSYLTAVKGSKSTWKYNFTKLVFMKLLYRNPHMLNAKLWKNLCESLVLSNRIKRILKFCVRFDFGLRKYDHVSHLFI